MADDESIEILVTDGGTTQQLINLLEQLGVSAEQATARVAAGFTRAGTSQQGLVSNSILLSRAAQNNSADISVLADALDAMTNSELNAAARSDVLTASWDAQAAAASTAAAANDVLAESATAAAEAETAAGAAGERAAAGTESAGIAAAATAKQLNLMKAALIGIAAYAGAKELGEASDEYTSFANKISFANSEAGNLNKTMSEAGGHIISLNQGISAVSTTFSGATGHIQSLGSALSNNQGIYTSVGDAASNAGSHIIALSKATDDANNSYLVANSNLIAAKQALADYDSAAKSAGSSVTALHSGFEVLTQGTDAAAVAETKASQSYKDLASQAGVMGAAIGQANSADNTRIELVTAVRQAQVRYNAAVAAGSDGLTIYSSQSKQTQETLDALTASAVSNGQSLEGTVNLYAQLRQATKDLGISNDQAIGAVQGLEDVLKLAGPSARQSAAAMRELAEGFATGTLSGKQFQALEREVPAIIAVVTQATGESTAQLKANGISVQQLVQIYNQQLPTLNAQAKNTIGTIGQAFTAVQNQLEAYIGKSQSAYTASSLVIAGIRGIGNALPIIIPLLAALAAGFAALKLYEVAAAFAAFATAEGTVEAATIALSAVFSPIGLLIAGIAAGIAYLVDGYANYLVATGQASDTTRAFGVIIQQVENAFAPLGDAVKQVALAFVNFISQLVGSNTHANDLSSTIKILGDTINTLAPYIENFGKVFIQVLSNILTVAKNLGVIIGNVIAGLAQVAQSGSLSSFGNPLQGIQGFQSVGDPSSSNPVNVDRDGGVHYARDGINAIAGQLRARDGYTIPGVDSPDTVPMNLQVSRGERVIVQTAQQQAEHDALYAEAGRSISHSGLLNFRDGGATDPGVVKVLEAYTSGQPFALGDAAANRAVNDGYISGGPDGSITLQGLQLLHSLGKDLHGKAIAAAANDNITASTTTASATTPTLSTVSSDQLRGAFGGAIGAGSNAFIASDNNSLLGYQGFTVSSPTAVAKTTTAATTTKTTTAAASTAATTDTSTADTTTYSEELGAYIDQGGVHTPITGDSGTSYSDSFNYDTEAVFLQNLSADDTFWQAADVNHPAAPNVFPAGGYIGANYQGTIVDAVRVGAMNQEDAEIAALPHSTDGSIYASADRQYTLQITDPYTGQVLSGPGSSQPNYRSGGIIYARDGADFMVPGADAVDSRALHMAVTPGERVQVSTPQQQAANSNGGGDTYHFNNNISTPNPNAFRQSSRQLGIQAARQVKRAGS